MRIFVTGASGWIGSAVVPELLGAGHDVVGLARSEASAQRLEAVGAIVQRGDVDDPDGLAKAAVESDGVIHLAFQHEVAWSGNFAAVPAAGLRVHAATRVRVWSADADEALPLREITMMMGSHDGPQRARDPPATAVEHCAPLGHFVTLDSPATADTPRELPGWEPTGPSLLEDLEQD